MLVFAENAAGLTGLDLVVLGAYLLAMLGMGGYIATRQKSTDDFFLGGRSLPAWAVGISIMASLLSTITFLGMPGEMFRSGLGFLTRQLGVPLVLLVVWFLWIPFFMRLNLTSAYEYLERRFNYPTRVLAAVFCLLLLLGWMAVVVLTASGAMAEIVRLDLDWFFGSNSPKYPDADMHAIVLSIGLFLVLHTTLGGLRAVVWTDVVQFFILIGGAIYTVAYVAVTTRSGPSEWLASFDAYPHRESVEWYSFDIGNRSTVLFISVGMVFWYICTHGANQVALQRYFSVKNVAAARWSYLVSAVANFFLGVVLAAVGLSLLHFVHLGEFTLPAESGLTVHVPDDATDSERAEILKTRTTSQDKVFPQFIAKFLPSGLRGMVVAALFAAAMSTIDSGANSVSTIVTVDFFRRNRPDRVGSRAELRLARVLTASMGLLIVAVSVLLYHISKGTDLISLCQKGFNCFLGPLGALFVLAMFSRSAVPETVIPAVLVGEAIGVCASYSQELFQFRFSTHLVVPTSWLATLLTSLLLGLVLGTRAEEDRAKWMWRAVVGKPEA